MTRTTPELAPSSPTRLATTYDYEHATGPYTVDQWNRVSNLEPSDPEAETLPLGHRGLLVPAIFIEKQEPTIISSEMFDIPVLTSEFIKIPIYLQRNVKNSIQTAQKK
ncbi:hypothetical protein AVEN_41098-1 [Araneus ventricosus]|uniref:Uncharacterized protein n=1 Tax=Araneus ventricosus TaxID=182803 RepID=A0A4Y2E5P3_ARAVE|nr:hypothetical protein AVEN_41098-1 [Araneus ventricosus]